MAIMKCPECQNDVSTRARSCPNCGYPLIGIDRDGKNAEPKKSPEVMDKTKTWFGTSPKKKIGIVVGIFVVLFVLLAMQLGKEENNYSEYESSPSSVDLSSSEDGYSVLKIHNVTFREENKKSCPVCKGYIKNEGVNTYEWVKVEAYFYSYGKYVCSDSLYFVCSEGIAPGETVEFTLCGERDEDITSCDASIIECQKR